MAIKARGKVEVDAEKQVEVKVDAKTPVATAEVNNESKNSENKNEVRAKAGGELGRVGAHPPRLADPRVWQWSAALRCRSLQLGALPMYCIR